MTARSTLYRCWNQKIVVDLRRFIAYNAAYKSVERIAHYIWALRAGICQAAALFELGQADVWPVVKAPGIIQRWARMHKSGVNEHSRSKACPSLLFCCGFRAYRSLNSGRAEHFFGVEENSRKHDLSHRIGRFSKKRCQRKGDRKRNQTTICSLKLRVIKIQITWRNDCWYL